MSVPKAPEILSVLKTRLEHCRALLDLSRRQSGLIAEDDYGELLAVLGHKQRILGRLDELKRRHPRLQQEWEAQRGRIDRARRDDCEHVLAETEAILAELLEIEQESTGFLARRRDATRRQLQAISQGTEVHRAYRDSLAPATHRHLDVGQ